MEAYNTVNRRSISASVLKTIAIVTMFIDHFGFTIVDRWEHAVFPEIGPQGPITAVFRMIGRIAFILFAFLLAEGFANTSNRARFVLRLIAGAVISEVPFDLICESEYFYIWDQNIFFTLTIGFCTVWVLDTIRSVLARGGSGVAGRTVRILLGTLTVLAGMALAELVRCDYGCMGVGLIVVFYLFRWRESLFWAALAWSFIGHLISDFVGYLAGLYKYSLTWAQSFRFPDWMSIRINLVGWAEYRLAYNIPGIAVALVLIRFYNGKKGRQLPKAFYYLFYPVHLLILYAAVRLMW